MLWGEEEEEEEEDGKTWGVGRERGGGYFGYQNKHTHKKKGGRIWVLGVGGVLVFRISVIVGFTGCVHVLLQPFPYPPIFLMYINPDSRGQCVLGKVKLLSSQSIAFNLHSSACGPHSGPEMCVLLFQRRAVYLELIRGTHTGPSGLEYTCMSVYMLFFKPVYVCSFVPTWKTKCLFLCVCFFYVPLPWVAIFVMREKNIQKPFLTDRPTNRHTVTIWQLMIPPPPPPPEMSPALTVKQRIRCVSFYCGIQCRRWDWCRHPQSHCALPLLFPVNQSEPSVFVMVEDNQFQNKNKQKTKVERGAGQWGGGKGGGRKNKIQGKEAL